MIIQNENIIDRFIRFLFAEISLLLALFWLGGIWQAIACVLGVVLFATALSGFCGLYRVFRFSTVRREKEKISKIRFFSFLAILLAVGVAGFYASSFFSKKFFVEDYNRMNDYYKQVLYNTGQDKREESISNYNQLLAQYAVFNEKYSRYHPLAIAGDKKFNQDLASIGELFESLRIMVNTGNLKTSHAEFEKARPIFQDILVRNGFSMFSIALVDFHDSMEKVIEAADKKDAAGVIISYVEADDKLKAVETGEIHEGVDAIRDNLEGVLELAKTGDPDSLSAKAAELKSSFIKVYMKAGN